MITVEGKRPARKHPQLRPAEMVPSVVQPAPSAIDEDEDFVLVYDATVAISPELDQIDKLR
jgi:hypothetical protein